MKLTLKNIAILVIGLLFGAVLLFFAYARYVYERNKQVTQQLAMTMVADMATVQAKQSATATSTPDWATKAAYFYQTATADPKSPVIWSLEVIQNGQPVPQQEGIYSLKRAPFTFRFQIPRTAFEQPKFSVLINTWNRPDNYEKLRPGIIEDYACWMKKELTDCIAFDGGAEAAHSDQVLRIDYENGIGSNFIYYKSPDDNRWDRVEFVDQNVILDRNVLQINLPGKENEWNLSSVEAFPENRLYLLFVLYYRAGSVITEDEFTKAIITFE